MADLLEYTSKNSGTYLTKVGNLRLFGLVEGPSSSMRVTPLARRILHPEYPQDAVAAKAEAFENVPLFKEVLDRYNGVPLPSKDGLTNYLVSELGLTQDKAAFVYVRLIDSAEQAGLFNPDKTKLLRPSRTTGDAPLKATGKDAPAPSVQSAPGSTSGARNNKNIDGVLDMLPTSDSGWNDEDLANWLTFFEDALRLYYKIPKGFRAEGRSTQ
jgi:hypothetical protein